MKPLEIKGARTRLGYTQQYMADHLAISVHSYRKKESGVVKFADSEKVTVAKLLGLSPTQVNDFFFDGQLPVG
jgi:Predicted transcriptional regulators